MPPPPATLETQTQLTKRASFPSSLCSMCPSTPLIASP